MQEREATIPIGDALKVTLVASMESLAAVSKEARCESMLELYQRMTSSELSIALIALRHLTTAGEKLGPVADSGERPVVKLNAGLAGQAALRAFTVTDMPALQTALAALLAGFNGRAEAKLD